MNRECCLLKAVGRAVQAVSRSMLAHPAASLRVLYAQESAGQGRGEARNVTARVYLPDTRDQVRCGADAI